MNTANTVSANPFGLMLDPQAVLQTAQHSPALSRLRQQQYMLLDRPAGIASADTAAGDLPDEVLLDEDDAQELLVSESVGGSHTYQRFPPVFN